MTTPDEGQMPTDPAQLPGWVMNAWASGLEAVIESMTADRPKVKLQQDDPASSAEGLVWWAQSLSFVSAPALWVGAPAESWKALGQLILAALGVSDASDEDIQSTCRDVVAQALSALAQHLSQELGEPVTGGEVAAADQPGANPPAAFRFTIDAGLESVEGTAVASAELIKYLEEAAHRSEEQPAESAAGGAPADSADEEPIPELELNGLSKLQLRVRVVLGRVRLPLRDVFKLNVGSVVELDRTVTDMADIMTGDQRLGRGEIVVVNGNYGIRITDTQVNTDDRRSFA